MDLPFLSHRFKAAFPAAVTLAFILLLNACSGRNEHVHDYDSFFARVQMSGIFDDSKTFADCVPKSDTADILRDYNEAVNESDFNLKTFVLDHFNLPPVSNVSFHFDSLLTVPGHIDSLWTLLTRHTGTHPAGSLLPLPYPYIVPGGRFREVYYWDSYFTMLGLRANGRIDLIRDMVDNFSYELYTYGFIPNGNRSYYLSRSQPPFFSLMVELLAGIDGDSVYTMLLPALETEYRFWMDGREKVGPTQRAYHRVVYMNDSLVLNRYWDNQARPRPESFREDSSLALSTGRDPSELYRNIRAACESGWDFSSRWLAIPDSLGSIITTRIVPVDLNCLLYQLEMTLSRAWQFKGDMNKSSMYLDLAEKRKQGIRRYFWNPETEFYGDYNYVNDKNTKVISLAGIYPLFFGIASERQAGKVANITASRLVRKFGVVTSVYKSGQQWDSPNGWPPLQYLAVKGFENYGMNELADTIRQRFEDHCLVYLYREHKFVEKYNVIRGMAGKGGEYPAQDGFGWTNGVVMQFLPRALDTVRIIDLPEALKREALPVK